MKHPAKTPPSPQQPAASPPGGARAVSPEAIERLSMTLQLERRARAVTPEELPFVMVNETRQLLPYRQAALFSYRLGHLVQTAVSGLAVPDASSPYSQWLRKFIKWRLERPDGKTFQRLDLAKIAAGPEKVPAWFADWAEWVPPHILWAPLAGGRNGVAGVLTLFREEAFHEGEARLFAHLSESYGQSFALGFSGGRSRARLSFLWLALLAVVVAAMFIPVRQSVLAPAEVTARQPALVRSGLDGVVDRFLVEPNQRVEKGQPLIRLDDAQLRTRLAVARKAEEMAAAEYRQLLQAGLSDPKAKQRLPLTLGRMEQLAAETAFVESQMERVIIASPVRGVVLCDNPTEWLGRPVNVGQRILLVADPDDLNIEIRLPATESLRLELGDELLFYPNVTPVSPLQAKVSFVGYRASEMPGAGMAFTLRADLAGGEKPLLGMRGMAKLYGPSRPLGLILLRTPIQAVRQWLGI